MHKMDPNPQGPRKSVLAAIGACIAAGTTLALTDLPLWVRATCGSVALLAAILGIAVVWPTVRRMIHDDA